MPMVDGSHLLVWNSNRRLRNRATNFGARIAQENLKIIGIGHASCVYTFIFTTEITERALKVCQNKISFRACENLISLNIVYFLFYSNDFIIYLFFIIYFNYEWHIIIYLYITYIVLFIIIYLLIFIFYYVLTITYVF